MTFGASEQVGQRQQPRPELRGLHRRSGHAESLRLGEEVALQFLREIVQTCNERVGFTVTKFYRATAFLSNS
jgi:hypothetical protein